MSSTKVTFQNKQGESLAGLLELPDSAVKFYAIFAHCFTCSKNSLAATYISRALAKKGIAVLRFDFTGLGNSAGDFSNTNFSSNIHDLIAADAYLKENYAAPRLLIGHSLGGAAVIAVAQHLKNAKAIVTIGAPATAAHVKNLFAGVQEEILENQKARVQLGGRNFTIQKQFVEDLQSHNSLDHIKKIDKALLIFHSPLDQVVSIDEAARIYTAARHPKSFISLDQADHLLSHDADAHYVASVLSVWASRYLNEHDIEDDNPESLTPAVKEGTVLVKERNNKFTREIFTEHHQLVSDEPEKMGGADLGPNPYELLLAALGSCTSMTLRMYANHKKMNLQNIEVELSHSRVHVEDCASCDEQEALVDKIIRVIKLTGQLDDAQRKRLLEIANKCPVHKTLENQIVIETKPFE
ncbi:bifunctional alpha/beta hydrolase/OsmC family protein [Nitrosomonas aestuarii]|uniref:bifunctional alpha/beta hydrolase/OsmC family protein n=1 Tax=Nitrosomonas aestuarii TaxID=52441 RepID=UPI000D304463|nr:bifunctional alpha/beta hydrolase/OsmC family protein [Nitrosomonas aestuarii]PTN07836.1 putative redox protein [Nitrosomonas aestuarii]